jgi:WD40-like Beta Propeller Repeat
VTPVDRGVKLGTVVAIPASVRQLLATGTLVHVAKLDPDGTPHVTLAWAGFDGDELRRLRPLQSPGSQATSVATHRRRVVCPRRPAAAFSILTRAFSAVAPSGPGSAIRGRSLAVVVFKHPFAETGPRTSPVHRIFAVGTDGSGIEPITPGDADYFEPAWSSDGTRLAVVRFERDGEQLDEAIYVIDRKTGEQQRFLTTGDPRPVSVLDIEWSGSKIGFVYARHGVGGEWDPP